MEEEIGEGVRLGEGDCVGAKNGSTERESNRKIIISVLFKF